MPERPASGAEAGFYVGDSLVQPSLNEITQGGVTRRIEPKAMDVLVLLADRPGQVVSKDELLASVWGGSFVTEHVLVREVWQLRQAFGGGDFIQTIPKRGYRLTAPVRRADAAVEAVPAPTSAPVETQTRGLPRRSTYAVLGVVALALALTAVVVWRQQATGASVTSLAVLPLADFSGDPAQDYLADAMTEELTTHLSKIAALRVISRTSAMRYKGTNKSIPEIGRELNVDAVIEGSIQRAGQQVRVTVQLVHAASERHLWAESYTRDVKDVLALRDELAGAIAMAVRINLTPGDRVRLQRGRTSVPEAHEAYLRGRHLADRGDWTRAAVYFEEAVQKDPKYALAWADLAEAYGMQSFGGVRLDLRDKRQVTIMRAQELDPDLPEVRDLLGDLAFYRFHHWAEGEAEYRRAVESDPGSFDAQIHYALAQAALGRTEAALRELRRAQTLNPLSPIVNNAVGSLLLQNGRAAEAVEQFQKTLELDPSYAPAQMNLGSAYERLGRNEEAIAAYLKALRVRGFASAELDDLQQAYRASGMPGFHRRRFEQQLTRAEKRAAAGNGSPIEFAAIYAGLGQRDLAFKYLDEAYEKEVGQLAWVKVAPEWAPLRDDPRFQDLLRRMNYPN